MTFFLASKGLSRFPRLLGTKGGLGLTELALIQKLILYLGMELDIAKAAEFRIKYLDMVQSIVTRLSGQGATIKNYCITVTTAVCGFAITLHRPAVALLALLPIIVFALLDTQYLRVERRFRALFEQIRNEDWGKLPSFEISLEAAPKIPYASVLSSWLILNFYAPLAAGVILVVLVARCYYGPL